MDKKNIHLVLLHGFAANKNVWGAFSSELAKDYTVHALDLPGYGTQSTLKAHTLAEIAHHILAQTTGCVIWLGWSLGGMIARYLAHSAPTRSLGLITLASTPKFVADGDWPCGVTLESFQTLFTLFKQDPHKGLLRFFSLQGHKQNRATSKQLLNLKKQALLLAPEVLLRDLQLLQDTDLRHTHLSCPEFNILGSEDPLIPMGEPSLKDLYPQAQNATIQAGHVPFLSHTGECLSHIHKFIHGSIAIY